MRIAGPLIVQMFLVCCIAIAASVLGACSASQNMLKAGSALTSPGDLVTNGVEAIANIPLPAADADPVGAPIEIYTRVAHGAQLCWFGAHGALKGSHIFHADAEPAAKGGRSEIVIHEKDASMPNPRGNRAFRVQITPSGDNATLDIENIRFPIETGRQMTADVRRWARNDLTCSAAGPVKGWDAQGATPGAPVPPKPATKAEHRT